ncbi:MAG: sugar nucleotide-binding protein [Magnetococcales bacterium]|nr:sugar nucleotide-binding protein [Magnetococcales bacterium]
MAKLLIIGASGYVGRHLFAALGPERALATWYSHPLPGGVRFDPETMRLEDLSIRPGRFSHAFLLHGMTRITPCAMDPVASDRVNVAQLESLLQQCAGLGIKPIFTSSDAVFDGSRGNHSETDLPNPLLRYARQKCLIERYLADSGMDHGVIRLPKVYSAADDGISLLSVWWRGIRRNETIRCAVDRIFSPIAVEDVVRGLIATVEKDLSGLFHLCGPEALSMMALFELFAQRLPPCAIDLAPCRINDLGFPETWPRNISMNPARFIQATGLAPQAPATVVERFVRGLGLPLPMGEKKG